MQSRAMSEQFSFSQITLAELFSQVAYSRSLRNADRQGLIAARMTGMLSEDDNTLIDRLLYGIRRGWLKVEG